MSMVKPSQLDRSRPGTWPIIYQVLVWIAIVCLILFLYNRFVRQGLVEEQQQYDSEISSLQTEYKSLYQYSLDLPLYVEQKNKLGKKLVSLLDYLPAKTEMPSLIDEIYKAAFKSNINFNQVTPQASIKQEYYDIEPIALSTATGFNNFASFVQYIGKLDRILNMRSFTFDINQKTAETLEISSNLETYIYNQDISKYGLTDEVDKK